jgi:hypothetical protein
MADDKSKVIQSQPSRKSERPEVVDDTQRGEVRWSSLTERSSYSKLSDPNPEGLVPAPGPITEQEVAKATE